MPVAEDKPAVDAILLKVMEAVPFQLTTGAGVDEARQRFRDVPGREVHPEVRSVPNCWAPQACPPSYTNVEALVRGMNALHSALQSP